jgi:fatty-acid desaturase
VNQAEVLDARLAGIAPERLPLPGGAVRRRVAWPNAIGVIGSHAVALLALLPWCFSWTGVVLAILGLYVFGTLGINLCYHRLLTHRGLVVPPWLEHALAILGVCCMQDTPARWVAIHRRHHQHADERDDPHSPLVNFFWGHMGWLLVENEDLGRLRIYERYSRDVLRDGFYAKLERSNWLWVIITSWLVFFLGGFAAELALGGDVSEAIQFAASVLVWGVFVRTVLVWHITWSINSVTHLWGYRNYETDEGSRNNVLIGLLSNGEGWHNNHHVSPRSAKHGHRWWELDVTWLTIRALALIGLAQRIVTPPRDLTEGSAPARSTTRGDPGVPNV